MSSLKRDNAFNFPYFPVFCDHLVRVWHIYGDGYAGIFAFSGLFGFNHRTCIVKNAVNPGYFLFICGDDEFIKIVRGPGMGVNEFYFKSVVKFICFILIHPIIFANIRLRPQFLMLPLNDYFCLNITVSLKPKKIVISGGPGTGKTSVVHALESLGYPCFHEVIRSMTLEAKKEGDPASFVTNPLAFVQDPYDFNRRILENRLGHFRQSGSAGDGVVFFDRGMPDVLAYMDYFRQEYADDFISVCEGNRYDLVLLLPPWKDIYISDNERLESFAESQEIHQFLTAAYERFGYAPVSVPEGSVPDRASFILDYLKGERYL